MLAVLAPLRPLFRLHAREASFARRGFTARSDADRRHLEEVGRTFLSGYNAALEEDAPDRLARRLDATDPVRRGFAWEGASMALALQDELLAGPAVVLRRLGLGPGERATGPGRRLGRLLEGPGRAHGYMLHVGAGWALARLKREVDRYLEGGDGMERWLAVDGYGFHEGYFRPATYLGARGSDGDDDGPGRARPDRTRHPRLRGYAHRVFDQGLGRSLWFVRGADPDAIARTIAGLDASRHGDLWSGAGLACAYAGAADASGIPRLAELAGERFAGHLAQGAGFAAEARELAGIPAAHTEEACRAWCGLGAAEAARRVRDAREGVLAGTSPAGEAPAYERWRAAVREALTGARRPVEELR